MALIHYLFVLMHQQLSLFNMHVYKKSKYYFILNSYMLTYFYDFLNSYYFGFGDGYDSDEKCYRVTSQADGTLVGTVPWESGLINGKGNGV